MPVQGLSASQMNNFRQSALGLIAKYDQNGDGKIAPQETAQTRQMGTDSYSFSNRLSHDYVDMTTVFTRSVSQLNAGQIAAADRNGDGQVDADELVNNYLEGKDGNKDGKLGFFEKMSTGISGMIEKFQTTSTIETNRTHRTVYDPQIDYNPGPTPPAPDYRPAPPPVYSPSRPTPPSPSGRPTPPSPSGRPTPPSVY